VTVIRKLKKERKWQITNKKPKNMLIKGCWAWKPGSSLSLDPVNLLSLCVGYCSALVQWDCNSYNVTKVLKVLFWPAVSGPTWNSLAVVLTDVYVKISCKSTFTTNKRSNNILKPSAFPLHKHSPYYFVSKVHWGRSFEPFECENPLYVWLGHGNKSKKSLCWCLADKKCENKKSADSEKAFLTLFCHGSNSVTSAQIEFLHHDCSKIHSLEEKGMGASRFLNLILSHQNTVQKNWHW